MTESGRWHGDDIFTVLPHLETGAARLPDQRQCRLENISVIARTRGCVVSAIWLHKHTHGVQQMSYRARKNGRPAHVEVEYGLDADRRVRGMLVGVGRLQIDRYEMLRGRSGDQARPCREFGECGVLVARYGTLFR